MTVELLDVAPHPPPASCRSRVSDRLLALDPLACVGPTARWVVLAAVWLVAVVLAVVGVLLPPTPAVGGQGSHIPHGSYQPLPGRPVF